MLETQPVELVNDGVDGLDRAPLALVLRNELGIGEALTWTPLVC